VRSYHPIPEIICCIEGFGAKVLAFITGTRRTGSNLGGGFNIYNSIDDGYAAIVDYLRQSFRVQRIMVIVLGGYGMEAATVNHRG